MIFRRNLEITVILVQIILEFLLGVFGNKIAETFNIELRLLLLISLVLILSLTILSCLGKKPAEHTMAEGAAESTFIPATMVATFPIGVSTGLLIGIILLLVGARTDLIYIIIPGNEPDNFPLLGFNELITLTSIFGIIIAFVWAAAVDSYLSASFFIGYCLSSASISVFYSHENPIFTYGGFFVFALVFGFVLVVLSPLFQKLKLMLYKPRF